MAVKKLAQNHRCYGAGTVLYGEDRDIFWGRHGAYCTVLSTRISIKELNEEETVGGLSRAGADRKKLTKLPATKNGAKQRGPAWTTKSDDG